MDPQTEAMVVAAWLTSLLDEDDVLQAAAPGGGHADLAPVGTLEPFVVFSYVGGNDLDAVGGQRIWHDGVWQVVARMSGSSYAGLDAAAARIDALLHGKHDIAVDGGTIESVRRVGVVQLSETVDGKPYRALGGEYKVVVQKGA